MSCLQRISLIANISAHIHGLPAGDGYPCLKTQRVRVSTFEKVTGTRYLFLLPVLCLKEAAADDESGGESHRDVGLKE